MFFFAFLTSSFDILSHLQPLAKHFFILFFLYCPLSQTALIAYHVWLLLSSTFSIFFLEVFASGCLLLTAYIYYHFFQNLSIFFLTFFATYFFNDSVMRKFTTISCGKATQAENPDIHNLRFKNKLVNYKRIRYS